MTFPSIRIEGTILSGELLAKLDSADTPGQRPPDFGFNSQAKLKDEIVRSWTAAQAFYKSFQHKLESVKEGTAATSETRNQWIIPLLGLLGFAELEFQSQPEVVGDKPFRFSHRLRSHGGFAVHIVGARESLDKKPVTGSGARYSPHAHLQEYLNLTEHLYAVVTNGRLLRLLRDSTRLVRLSYVEFDLDRMFGEDLFADFAVFYRLLHVSRLPKTASQSPESLLEHYHQDSLASGERIRDGLSGAVKESILLFADGFLNHPKNDALRQPAATDVEFPAHLYQQLLRLVYRLLFLMVIEERDLVYAAGADKRKRNLYYAHYSLARLRRVAEKRHLADGRHHDCWDALCVSFRLFDETGAGRPLGIEPLGGDLFDSGALGPLASAMLDNDTLLACLRNLSLFRNPDTGNLIRVNYAALNVEEFGSVYQGLLEFEPQVTHANNRLMFSFVKGDERSRTGSHYTPDELVQPLIKHSLDYLIADKLKEKNKENALLTLRVADIACGSGHILLAAARRIGTELAVLRSGDDQPSPAAFREAVRDVIRHCIYGMDLNPLAVELCKVALWLEAHVPGWPLSFLDHRIHCGNAIVGLAHRAELQRGIPDEAFKTLPGDDKVLATALRKQNKEERKGQTSLDFAGRVENDIRELDEAWQRFDQMPERSAADYYTRRTEYEKFRDNIHLRNLRLLADAQVAQFYLPKAPENRGKHVTHDTFSRWMEGLNPTGLGIAAAMTVAHRKRFGHWFIEFWDVVDAGGFDLIIGNPPYLGGTKLSGSYGYAFCEWVKWEFAPTGLSDLVVYFLRRIYDLLRSGGFVAFITTNSIKDGDIREDGLQQIIRQSGNLVFVNSGMKWPGVASLYVALLSIHKGAWLKPRELDGRIVPHISAFLDDSIQTTAPRSLGENSDLLFAGYDILGDGFLITHEEAAQLVSQDMANRDVVFPSLNGEELNNDPEQRPSRSVINFVDRTIGDAKKYARPFEIIESRVKPFRDKQNRTRNREVWWLFNENRAGLRAKLSGVPHCFGAAATTKHLCFSKLPTHYVFTHALKILASPRWSDFAVMQCTLHEVWARKYSGALETRLRYSPTDCFATFPFPRNSTHETALAVIGETYHVHRSALMRDLWLGLTDLYNLFHDPELTSSLVTESLGDRATIAGDEGFTRLLRLRDLHCELDQTVLTAYGWHTASDFGPPLALGHNFHTVEFLPENDRIRYTIHPDARRELLTRLLKLNHVRAAQAELVAKQAAIAAPVTKKKATSAKPTEVAARKHSKGINFKRGAIASYAVDRLGHRWEFGRTQMEKVLYLAQQEVGIDLEMEFQREAAGPFDEEIHKLESLAAKEGWFLAARRPGDKGTSYHRGANIDSRCGAAASILGEAKSKFDSILDWLAKMDTEQAEIWATIHAVWNDLLLANQPVTDDGIIQGVYAWHPSKARFAADRILTCIGWMRKEGYVPRGVLFETREPKASGPELELGLDLFGRAVASVPAPTWMDRPLVLPTSRRVVLAPDRYRATVVPHLLYQAGGNISFDRLRKAYWLLTEPRTLERYASSSVGDIARGWARTFRDTLEKDRFIEHLKGAVGRQLHFIQKGDERWLELRDPKVADDEHVIFDARLALLVADLWPVAEPITPLAPAEEITIQELEAVL
jgi:methylase of polypeptide subunit release factors